MSLLKKLIFIKYLNNKLRESDVGVTKEFRQNYKFIYYFYKFILIIFIYINLFYFFVWYFLFNFHIVSNWIMTGNTAQLNKKLGRVEKNVQIVYIFYLNLVLLNFCVESNLIYLKGIALESIYSNVRPIT
jgi:hypothetical protein